MTMKHVLIVDDHPPVIRVLRLGLEAAGFEVSTACNGADCLDSLRDGHPDFLVTDIDMPTMTGKELCQKIVDEHAHRIFPIVVLTSRTELEHRDWTKKIDNLTFMEKPVSVRRLVSHIQEQEGETAGVEF